MARIFLISTAIISLFLVHAVYAQEHEQVIAENSDPEMLIEVSDVNNESVREFEIDDFFGDPDLCLGEAIRSPHAPIPAWQIYLQSWGVWIVVRFDNAYSCIKSTASVLKEQMVKRAKALLGLVYARQIEKAS